MRDTDRALVQAATAVVRLRCRPGRHPDAAAARTADGRLFTAVGVEHVTGGVCAEVVLLGTAATQGVTELETIVAMDAGRREIMTPCARCRQILAEHQPAIRVIVGPAAEPRVVPLAELPPPEPVTG
ncbi:cytidine/deoxycytidylate deaminase family protein [Micromonospora zhanjiangensis]|uniref:Cytidine deaminase n=1 Tax=Micromonospora zhanjiangensis TaxID=1522057 RepID=A0ABV8KIL8_9ACTN